MGFVSDRAAEELNEFFTNAPQINNESYWNAFDEVMSEFTDDIDISNQDSAALYIASAIHEFSKMINKHILGLVEMMIEDKYKEDK